MAASRNSLRIIGGAHKGRRLQFYAVEGLRPTTDRIRETLFNWLQGSIEGAHVLDLFAGSGALGFEASSRGASKVVMIERNRHVADQLKKSAALLDAETNSIRIKNMDAGRYLQSESASFDLVFVDPPFRKKLLQPAIDQLESASWLASNALLYLELGAEEDFPQLPDNWKVIREKQAGQVRYCLISRSTNSSQ